MKEASDTINALWSDITQTNNDTLVQLYNILGHSYKMAKNATKARVIWEKSLNIQPQQKDIKDELSRLPQLSRLHKRISLAIE